MALKPEPLPLTDNETSENPPSRLLHPNAIKTSPRRGAGCVGELHDRAGADDIVGDRSPRVARKTVGAFEAVAFAGDAGKAEKDAGAVALRGGETQHAGSTEWAGAGAKFLQIGQSVSVRIIIGAATGRIGGAEIANLPRVGQTVSVRIGRRFHGKGVGGPEVAAGIDDTQQDVAGWLLNSDGPAPGPLNEADRICGRHGKRILKEQTNVRH